MREDWREEAARAARRLFHARLQAGMSQGMAAKAAGINRPTLTWLESGKQRITLQLLWQLCIVYNIQPGAVVMHSYSYLDSEASEGWPSLGRLPDSK